MNRKLLPFLLFFSFYQAFGQPIFKLENQIVPVNQSICNSVRVDNFTDILTAQFTLAWNPAIVKFDSLNNLNLPGLSKNNFGLSKISQGILSFSWFDGNASGKSLPDGSVLFGVCFTAVGAAGDSSYFSIIDTPIKIEVTDINSDGEDIGSFIHNGSIKIEDNKPGLAFDHSQLKVGGSGCNHLSAKDLSGIKKLSGTLNWDPSIVQFDSVCCLHPSLPGQSFNTLLSSQGKVLINYTLPGLIDVSADDVLAGFCFTALSIPDTFSVLTLDGSYFPLNVADEWGMSIPLKNGTISILQDEVNFQLKDQIAEKGSIVNIPVISAVSGELKSFSGNLSFPAQELSYNQSFSSKLAGFYFDTMIINNGTATLSWDLEFSNAFQDISLGDTLFSIKLSVNGIPGNAYPVSLVDSGYPLSISLINGKKYDLAISEDTAYIHILSEKSKLKIGFSQGNKNDIVCVPVTVKHLDDISAVGINFLTDSTILKPIEVIDAVFPANPVSNFIYTNQTVSVQWGDPDNAGTFNLQDDGLLLKLCYQLIGIPGSIGNIDIDPNSAYYQSPYKTGARSFIAVAGAIEISNNILSVKSEVINNTCSSLDEGIIELFPQNGTVPISYKWSNGSSQSKISGLSNGSYYVTITDSAVPPQTVILSFNLISQFNDPEFSPLPDVSIACPDQVVKITADNPALIYNWTGDGFTKNNTLSVDIDQEGVYVIEGIDPVSSCSKRDTFYVFPPPPLESAFVKESYLSGCNEVLLESLQTLDVTGVWIGAQGNLTKLTDNTTLATDLMPGLQFFVWKVSTDQCIEYSSDTCWVYKRTEPEANDDLVFSNFSGYNILSNDQINPGTVTLSFENPLPYGVLISSNGVVVLSKSFDQWDSKIKYLICDPVCKDYCSSGVISFTEIKDTLTQEDSDGEALNIPNAISPNGDGFNDRLIFDQIGQGKYTQPHLIIFDRLGRTVADIQNYTNTWEGTDLYGKELPVDTYYFVLYLDHSSGKLIKGPVSIIK